MKPNLNEFSVICIIFLSEIFDVKVGFRRIFRIFEGANDVMRLFIGINYKIIDMKLS